jgi:uncharacterized membrane protein
MLNALDALTTVLVGLMDPENRPEDWREQRRRWDRYRHVRVAGLVAASALLVTALTWD